MQINYQKIASPVGELIIAADEQALRAVSFTAGWVELKRQFGSIINAENFLIRKTIKQLDEYFKGKRRVFDLPIKVEGTVFQKKVWNSLKKIPFGVTKSYKEQAKFIKSPRAVRAVGRTNGLNPICIVLPCHRVIGSNGTLTGFGGGIKAKRFLLALEGVHLEK